MEHAVQDGQVLVGRDDIHAVALQPLSIPDLGSWHFRRAGEDLRKAALVLRIEVLNEDKRHPGTRPTRTLGKLG